MIDIVALAITLIIVLSIFLRKTSAGVAIFALLAGVLLDQLLSAWILSIIPQQSPEVTVYIQATIRLLLTFTPAFISIFSVKANRYNAVPALLTAIALGFLMTYFVSKIIIPLPIIPSSEKESGLLVFLQPYQNEILAISAVFALVEMVLGFRKSNKKLKDKK